MDDASAAPTEDDGSRRDGDAVRVEFFRPCATAHCPNCAQADLLQAQIRDLGRELRALKLRAGSVVYARMRWCLALLLKAAKAGEPPAAKVFRRADDVLAKVYAGQSRGPNLRLPSDPSAREHSARTWGA